MRLHLVHVLGIALLTTAARGQDVGEGTVTGHGSMVIERLPDILRVDVLLLARGKDYRDALTRLDARCAIARKWLVELGASEGTIFASELSIIPAKPSLPIISTAPVDGLAPAGESASPGSRPDAKARPVPPTISKRLRADLPVKATGSDELFLVAEDLQKRVKDADLGGIKELGEDAMRLQIPGCVPCGGGGEVGAPSFQFVSRMGAEERSKALAIAFSRARSEAAQLARAAGCELGELRSLSSTSSGALDFRGMFGGPLVRGDTPQMTTTDASIGTNGPSSEGYEATGIKPGHLQYRIGVNATFALKSPSGDQAAVHRSH